jgi:ribosome assembly protein RRB1
MSKRTFTEVQTSNDGQAVAKASSGAPRRVSGANEHVEMGEFEDAWEDEVDDSEEEIVDGTGEDREGGVPFRASFIVFVLKLMRRIDMEIDEVLPPIEESEEQQVEQQKEVYIPGRHVLAKDEILEPDDSVYEMRHVMGVDWPCLSFDVLRDNLGDERQRYPATAYIVSGTQADSAKNNELCVYKMSSLHRTQKDGGASMWFYTVAEKQCLYARILRRIRFR